MQLPGSDFLYIKNKNNNKKVIQQGQEKNYALDQKVNFHFHVVQPGSYILLVDKHDITTILM